MANTRIHGNVVFECDCCDETLETNERVFGDAVDAKREAGWKSEKVEAEWLDLCPKCAR